MKQDVFGTPLDLFAPFDFSFITRYGTPFSVQVGGSEARFGVNSPQHGQLLLRFAGAPLDSVQDPEEAAIALAEAMPAYETLYPHPALLKLQGHGAVAGGYLAIFRWPAGENLAAPGAVGRWQRQPLLSELRMIDPVLDFHAYALAKGYQAVGFQESCLSAEGRRAA